MSPIKRVVGIDASWTGCALTRIIESDESALLAHVSLVVSTKPADFPCRMARLSHLREQVRDFVFRKDQFPDLIVIENYAFGAQNGRELAGELGGTIRLLIHTLAPTIPIVEVPPSTLKAWVTGKGNSDKNVMLREVFRRWNYEASDDNDADSYALARFGLECLAPEHTKVFEGYLKKVSRLNIETRQPKEPKPRKGRKTKAA